MSLVNLAHVCSHLQNASKARLGLTSIPVTKLHVALMLGLQKQGFISSVTLGGPAPPKPVLLQKPPKYRGTPEEREAKNLAEQLREARKLERRQKKGLLLNARQLEKVIGSNEVTRRMEEQRAALKAKGVETLVETQDGQEGDGGHVMGITEIVERLTALGFDETGTRPEIWPESLRDAYPAPQAAVRSALLDAWVAKHPEMAEVAAPALLKAAEQAELEAEEAATPEVAWGRAPEWSYKEVVPANPGQRRLWVGLKYWKNEPVLNKMHLISKPTRRIWVNSDDLAKITRGRESAFVKGLTKTGECMFVTTDKGIMEARECVEKKLGGMVLCRVI